MYMCDWNDVYHDVEHVDRSSFLAYHWPLEFDIEKLYSTELLFAYTYILKETAREQDKCYFISN